MVCPPEQHRLHCRDSVAVAPDARVGKLKSELSAPRSPSPATRALVINLDHRTDRLSTFQTIVADRAPWLPITRLSATLGKDLRIDDAFLERVIAKYRAPALAEWMRGNFGCTLSHVSAWRAIASCSDAYTVVFEDDAAFVHDAAPSLLKRALNALPAGADFVFLNDYNRPDWRASLRSRVRGITEHAFGARAARLADRAFNEIEFSAARFTGVDFREWEPSRLKTMEAYVMSPAVAAAAADFVEKNLGASDIQFQAFAASRQDFRYYELVPPLFTQQNRGDSDIRTMVAGRETSANPPLRQD
jgi:GR25 family glycosyltransferase involved in LPS biosynthesis